MTNPEIDALLAERDIRHLIFRYCRGIDRLDFELVESVFWPDARLRYGAEQSPAEFAAGGKLGLPLYALTQHSVSNVIIEVDGDTAKGEAYCQARHRTAAKDGEPAKDFLWGGRYVDRYERRNGEWRISRRICVHEWTKLETVDGVWPNAAAFVQGNRTRADVVYQANP
ncbi:MAG: nuclear transport factor 2 family protein [Dehalococcoidia bacterium]